MLRNNKSVLVNDSNLYLHILISVFVSVVMVSVFFVGEGPFVYINSFTLRFRLTALL